MTALLVGVMMIYHFDPPWWWSLLLAGFSWADFQLAAERQKDLYESARDHAADLKRKLDQIEAQLADLQTRD